VPDGSFYFVFFFFFFFFFFSSSSGLGEMDDLVGKEGGEWGENRKRPRARTRTLADRRTNFLFGKSS
jgi:hypothetical protein